MILTKRIALIAGIVFFAAWAVGTPSAGQTATAVPDDVKALFKSHCAVCHKGLFAPKGLKLGPDALPGSVLNIASKEKPDLKLVAPGSPADSYLLKKVRGEEGISGKRMPPPSKTPLAAEEIALIEAWVRAIE